jgi:F0F1-type ATP synthase alpha subunit
MKLKKKLKNRLFNKNVLKDFIKIPKQNFGKIESINYGCAKIIGLNKAKMGEKVKCSKTNSIGSVVGIDPKYTFVLFYTNINVIQTKMDVFRSTNMLSRNIKNIKTIFGNITNVVD